MNKQLLVTGCSHSARFNLKEGEKAWFEYFAEDHNYNVKNIAKSASSLEYSITNITKELYKNNYDLIFLQLTDLARITIGVDGKESFLQEKFVHKSYMDIQSITLFDYLQAVKDNNEAYKYLYENVMYSSYYLESIINNLFLLQKFCIFNNIKLILIPYSGQHWSKRSRVSIWNLECSKKIIKDLYIQQPFLEWFSKNKISNDYFLDNGYHLNADGQKLMYEKWLIPNIKNFLI